MIRVRCRHCGRRFHLRAEDAGKKGRCPNSGCRQPFRAPEVSNADAAKSVNPKQDRRRSLPKVAGKGTGKRKKRKRGRSRRGINYPVWGATVAGLALIVFTASFWSSDDAPLIEPSKSLVAAEPVHPLAQVDFNKDITPIFQKYCVDCHSNDFHEGDFSFERYSTGESIKDDREIWRKVLHLTQLGAMPPADSDQPTEEERKKITDWVDYQLFYVDCSIPHDPGRVTSRRLNRNEYNNTIRDLLGVDFKPAEDFPSDDVGYGFDNIGDVLSVPPLLIEKYLTAAEQVAEKSIATEHPNYFKKVARGKELKEGGSASGSGNGRKTMASTGHVYYRFRFPETSRYRLRIDAEADQAGDELAKMQVKLDDKELKVFEIEGENKQNIIEYEFDAPEGDHTLTAGFINDFYDPNGKNGKDRNLFVEYLQVEGPLELPKAKSKDHVILKVYPEDGVSVRHAASANLREFLPRAFRRPATEQEVASYTDLVELAADRGESFERAMQVGLQTILVSPHFLFRIEDRSQQIGEMEQLDDYALATRLSYFLWSSMPDAELLELAEQNKLHEPAILEQQTKRMLADARIEALISNFSGQWLGLRKLTTNEVAPNPELFPAFNDKLRKDMWRETELFFGSIVKENRNIYELLDGRYSFLNERLAKLYGIDGVQGEEFRRVNFTNDQRMGVLTHASVLTLTSYPNRTSPVKRGQWVLENMLNDAPPDPPPTAPSLEETAETNPNLSFREQLELHRKDPGCAACHVTMDEIGFGLENFDAIGRWRTKDGKFDVDPSGTLPSGESFNGPKEMIAVLANRKTQFGRCLTEKLMTFALGRGLEYYDRCAIDKVMSDLERDDRFATVVLGIVQSAPFQKRRSIDNE